MPADPAHRTHCHTTAASTWVRGLIVCVLALTAFRILTLALLPVPLTGDEAQYWDWSRLSELAFSTKGPMIAWLIGLSTQLLYVDEWTVRLPSVIAGALTMLTIAALGWRMTGSFRRGAAAGLCVALVPAFVLTASLATIDAAYLAFWAASCLCAWVIIERWRADQAAPIAAIVLGSMLGLGFLTKFTIALLVPGLIGFLVFEKRSFRVSWSDITFVATGFAYFASDVVIWNAQHDWPTVRHLLGHLHAEVGDLPAEAIDTAPSFSILWPLEFIGLQLAAAGPILALMAWGIARRARRGFDAADRFALWCAAPVILGYFAISFIAPTEANWPIAGYLTLCIIAGRVLPGAMRLHHAKMRAWKADTRPLRDKPRQGILRKAPESLPQISVHWAIGFAIGAALVIPLAAIAPKIEPLKDNAMVRRVSEGRTLAAATYVAVLETERDWGETPAIIANRYTRTAQLAFGIPGHPIVSCASAWLGDRSTAYDLIADTRLDRDAIAGRPAVLVGGSEQGWREAFGFETIEVMSEAKQIYRVRAFPDLAGPTPQFAAEARAANQEAVP